MSSTKTQPTKEFLNSFGRPIQLTRDEYIQRWIRHTTQLFDIFEDASMSEDFIKVQAATHRAAFKAWEKHI
jgi:hypothetical protein